MWVIMCAAVSLAEQRGNGREGERWILNANDFAVRDRRGEFSSSSFFFPFFFLFFERYPAKFLSKTEVDACM